MDNKSLIPIIGLLLVIGLVGEVLFYLDITQFDNITWFATGAGRLGGLILLLRHGSIIKARPFFQLILVFIGITIIGAMTKIMHWPFNSIILITGLLGIAIIYFVRFIKKQNKDILDILKLLWLTVLIFATIFTTQHFPFGHELKGIEGILFLIMIAYFAFKEYQPDNSGQIDSSKDKDLSND